MSHALALDALDMHPLANLLDMHPLAAASRSRLLETEPKLFVFETSYAFCGRYCFESVVSIIK